MRDCGIATTDQTDLVLPAQFPELSLGFLDRWLVLRDGEGEVVSIPAQSTSVHLNQSSIDEIEEKVLPSFLVQFSLSFLLGLDGDEFE